MSEVLDNLTTNADGSRSNAEGVVVHQPWMAQNSTDLKVNENLAKFKTTDEISRAIMDSNGKMDELKNNTIPKMGDNPTEEQKSAYFKATGRPDTVAEYSITKPSDLPEGYNYDEGFEQLFRTSAHKHGASNEAAVGMYNDILAKGTESYKKITQNITKADAKSDENLKTSWGTSYDANTEKSERAIKRFDSGEDGAMKLLADTGLLKHPEIKKLFHRIHENFGDDFFIKGDTTNKDKVVKYGADGKPMLKFTSMGK